MKDYISEISSPSISPDNLSGIEVQSYLRLLESARQSFIGSVAQYPNNVVKAYLNELMEAKKVIIKRGLLEMSNLLWRWFRQILKRLN